MVCTKKHTRGFSLIEMLVAFAIAVLIVSSILLRFRAFDSVLGLKGVAYDLALTIRTAQVWSVSAGLDRSLSSFDTNVGVYVDLNNPHQYVMFEDRNYNGEYDAVDFVIETYEFRENYRINEICYDDVYCTTAGTGPYDEISITFQRPEFDPIYCAHSGGGCHPPVASASSVDLKIVLAVDPAQVFEVEVGVTGQISVTAPAI